jgi:hypothetical protein
MKTMPNDELKQEYEQQKERRATLTTMTLASTDGMAQPPTPTQEENDLAALGLLHPDEKAQADLKPMPPVAAQQAYLATGEALPAAPAAKPAARPAAPRQEPVRHEPPRHERS